MRRGGAAHRTVAGPAAAGGFRCSRRRPVRGVGTGGVADAGAAGVEGLRVGRYGTSGPPAPGTGKAPVARRVISP